MDWAPGNYILRYNCLVKGLIKTEESAKKPADFLANSIIPGLKLPDDLWQMGKSKVFLKQELVTSHERATVTLTRQIIWKTAESLCFPLLRFKFSAGGE